MDTCKNCQYWLFPSEEEFGSHPIIQPYDDVHDELVETEEMGIKYRGFRVRYCKHPKVVFYQTPDRDGAVVVDGSQYKAALITAEDFGCILHAKLTIDSSHELEEKNMKPIG